MRHLTKKLTITAIFTLVFIFFTLHPSPFTSMNAYAASKGNPPVAHWRFDESGGPTAYDESANNNDGTLNSGAGGTNTVAGQMWTRQGKISGALECDGTDDWVNIGSKATLNVIGDNITVSAWVKTNVNNAFQTIVGRGNDWRLNKSNSTYQFEHRNSSNVIVTAYSSNVSTDWIYVAGTYERDTLVKLYINGVLVDSRSQTGSTRVSQTENQIGNNYAWHTGGSVYNDFWWNGLIDDVKIYNYARTADQILVDYNAGVAVHLGAGIDSNEGNPPIAYYAFDENTGQTGYDRSGSSNNGTLGSTSGSDANDPVWSLGKYGSALKFDGTNDMVEVLDTNNTLDLTTAGTIECWAYINNNYRFWIAAKCASASNPLSNYYFGTGSGNKWLGGIGNGTTQQDCSDPNVAPTGIWTHAAFTFDGTKLKLYINGIKVNEINQTITPLANNDHLSIGCWGTAASYPANGYIDEIKIYNYARTQAQIVYDYNKGKPVAHYKFDEGGGAISHNEYSSADTGTASVGWWRMDETSWNGTANEVIDSSGKANNGVRVGDATTSASSKIGPYAGTFDGTGDYINLGATTNLNFIGTSDFTFSAWVYENALPPSAGAAHILFNIYQDANNSYQIGILDHADNSLDGFYLRSAKAGTHKYFSDRNLSGITGSWRFLTVVYNNVAQSATLYVNGAVVTSYTLAAEVIGIGAAKYIGSRGSDYHWNGKIDDVRIYNYARTSGQIYNDYKTTHGTLVGNTKFVDGKIGKALNFDGAGDYIELISNTEDLLGADPSEWSYSAWFKTNGAITSKRDIISNYDSSSGGDSLLGIWTGINADGDTGRIFINVRGTGAPDYLYTPSGTRYDNSAWHHIAVTAKKGDYVKGYIDGVKFTSDGSSSLSTNDYIDNAPLRIGVIKYNGAISEHWNGLIDDVRIYNYARSVDQVLQDYNAGLTTRLGTQSAGEADPWGGALPVAYWTLDENTGVLANDASGNGNNGTLTNGPTWTQGKTGPCLNFTRSNGNHVKVSDNNILDISGAFSISAWIKADDLGSNDTIVAKRDYTAGDANYSLRVDNGRLRLFWYNGPLQDCWEDTASITVGTWYHVAGVYNGTNSIIYVNGKETKRTSPTAAPLPNNNPFAIGAAYASGTGDKSELEFNGKIDDVQLYNYARTQAQIAWDYNRGKPVARWRFDEATSGSAVGTNNIKDNSGDARHGSGSGSNIAWVAGKSGGALSFNGTNDYVNCGTGSVFNFQEGNFWTVELWMKTSTAYTGIQGGKKLLSKATGGALSGYAVAIGQINSQGYDNKIGFTIDGPPGNNYVKSFNTLPAANDGNWHHVTIVFDASTNVKVGASIYFDGVNYGYLDSTVNKAGWSSDAAQSLRIGSGTGGEYFTGQIDDARIYNYARTADQILQDYNAGLAVKLGE